MVLISDFILSSTKSDEVVIINAFLSYILMYLCKYSFLIFPEIYATIINYSFDSVFFLGVLLGVVSLFENKSYIKKSRTLNAYEYLIYSVKLIFICATTTTLIIPIILSKVLIAIYYYINYGKWTFSEEEWDNINSEMEKAMLNDEIINQNKND